MTYVLSWNIHPRPESVTLPKAILTLRNEVGSSALAPEVAGLLPTQSDTISWLADLPETPEAEQNVCAGVFIGNPHLRKEQLRKTLSKAGLRWLSNLPSTCQHDDEFISNLNDVGLGPVRELETLAAFQNDGLDCIAAVGSAADAQLAVRLGLTRLFVLPKTRQYEGGFPSELSRNRAVAEIITAIGPDTTTVLSLVKESEVAVSVVWPSQAAGVIAQPKPL